MWFLMLVIYGESWYRRRPICHAEPCCHATGVWLLLYNVFCVYSVLCFMKELKYIGKTTNALFDHCCRHGTVLTKKKEKKRNTFKKLTCCPSPVKNFSNVTIRNLSRNKMLPFSCTKEKFMKNLCSEECDIVFISLKWTWWFMGNMLIYSWSGM